MHLIYYLLLDNYKDIIFLPYCPPPHPSATLFCHKQIAILLYNSNKVYLFYVALIFEIKENYTSLVLLYFSENKSFIIFKWFYTDWIQIHTTKIHYAQWPLPAFFTTINILCRNTITRESRSWWDFNTWDLQILHSTPVPLLYPCTTSSATITNILDKRRLYCQCLG